MPDSHLRHWINNEGPVSIYEHIKSKLKNKSLSIEKLNFWFMYWIINITGFRAEDFSKGSKYLTQNIYKCISTLLDITEQIIDNPEINPMKSYLKKRGEWLELSNKDLYLNNPSAFGSLSALLYVYDAKRGQKLYQEFFDLSDKVKNSWYQYTEYQLDNLDNLDTPSSTYTPAWFHKIAEVENLESAIKNGLPLFLMIVDKEKEMRAAGDLPVNTPVSFKSLADDKLIAKFLKNKNRHKKVESIDINKENGQVSFNYEN